MCFSGYPGSNNISEKGISYLAKSLWPNLDHLQLSTTTAYIRHQLDWGQRMPAPHKPTLRENVQAQPRYVSNDIDKNAIQEKGCQHLSKALVCIK